MGTTGTPATKAPVLYVSRQRPCPSVPSGATESIGMRRSLALAAVSSQAPAYITTQCIQEAGEGRIWAFPESLYHAINAGSNTLSTACTSEELAVHNITCGVASA